MGWGCKNDLNWVKISRPMAGWLAGWPAMITPGVAHSRGRRRTITKSGFFGSSTFRFIRAAYVACACPCVCCCDGAKGAEYKYGCANCPKMVYLYY